MRFIYTNDDQLGRQDLLKELEDKLSTKRVLWLISGGSNIFTEVSIMDQLTNELTSRLSLLLADERYGPAGHEDSNYTQLLKAGLNIKQASFPDILRNNLSPNQTVNEYSQTFNELKSRSDMVIAELGIGDDGHIAGALPNSPAVNSMDAIVYYEQEPYKRLSLTLNSLKTIDETYVFCFGNSKLKALTRLREGTENIQSLPSMILLRMPSVTVYNDQLKEGS